MRRNRPDVSVFAGAAPFAGYSGPDLAPLAPYADRLVVLPGAALAEAGRRPHEVLVLLSGEAIVSGGARDGAVLRPGTVIGAAAELSGEAHAETVVAGGGVSALVLTGAAFRWAVQSLPGLRDRLDVGQPADAPDAAVASAAGPQGDEVGLTP
jgi:CRP-like cAMP-binding protein